MSLGELDSDLLSWWGGVFLQIRSGGRKQGARLSGDGNVNAVAFGFQLGQLVGGQAVSSRQPGVVTAVAAGPDHVLQSVGVAVSGTPLGVLFTGRFLVPAVLQGLHA